MTITAGQRNILRFMAPARWVYVGLAALFTAIGSVQWYTSTFSGGPHLSDYLWIGTDYIAAAGHLLMFAIIAQWYSIFRGHLDG